MNRLAFLTIAAALLAALTLAACGGDGGEDEDEITQVIETVATGD